MAGSRLCLGMEIGGSKFQAALGAADGTIAHRHRAVVDRKLGAAGIRAAIAKLVAEWKGRFAWSAVGVGYGGPIDWRTGAVRCSHHVEGWNDFPLRDWLEELCGCTAIVENDTNSAALGEAVCGQGRGFDPVFYSNSGSGVGGGLVAGGKIYHGDKPGEAEFGHVRLDRDGNTVESRCSGWAMDKKIRAAVDSGETTVLSELIGASRGGESKHLAAALGRGDEVAGRLLEETAHDLAFGLSHVVHLFHPQVIVLGGGLSLVGEPWRAAVERFLPRYVMEAMQPPPPVRLSALGEDVVTTGALLLAHFARGE